MNAAHADMTALLAFVKTLPQARVIDADDCVEWLRRVQQLDDGQSPMWHARRLRGIGSSEIGACVATMRGEYAFNSAHDIVKSKLMRLAPDGGSGDTRRGQAMEPVIRDMFHAQFQTKSETRLLEAMTGMHVRDAPWMVGNPDDLCVIGNTLYIVDFKSPRSTTLADYQRQDGVNFEYVCQLHHLEHIGRANGVPIGGRLLCSLDIDEWKLDVRFVEHDPALLKEMIDVGQTLWHDYVLRGEAPRRVSQPTFENMSEADTRALLALTQRFALLKTVVGEADERAKETAAEILQITGNYRIENSKVRGFCCSVKADQLLDTDILTAVLQRHGMPVPDFEDDEALLEAMEALDARDEPRARYLTEKHKLALSRTKQDTETLSALKSEAGDLIASHLASHLDHPPSPETPAPEAIEPAIEKRRARLKAF